MRNGKVPDKDISRIADEYLSFMLGEDEKIRTQSGKKTFDDIRSEIFLYESLLKRDKRSLIFNDVEDASDDTKLMLDITHTQMKPDSDEYRILCREILKRRVVRWETGLKHVQGDYGSQISVTTASLPASSEGKSSHSEDTEYSLKQLKEKYYQEKEKSGAWINKTKKLQDSAFTLLFEVFGEDTIASCLAHRDLLHFRDDVLVKMPSNRFKHDKYKGKTYQQILGMKDVVPMNIATINGNLIFIASFFKWCSRHDFIPKNIAEGLLFNVRDKMSEKRKIYDKDDIINILKNLPYGDADAHKYWVPLIALYSGMRQNEICQLLKKDIIVKDGICCFSVNTETDGKKVKTQASVRLVPVHPLLIKLGLLKYCEKLKGDRMWPRLEAGRDGYGQYFQRWYGRFNRKFVTEDKKKTFHSTRHVFINFLKQHDISETIIKELVGHSDQSITTGLYGKSYNVKLLYETIQRIDYEVPEALIKIRV